ncbi:MAG: hypothetical protein ABIP78_01265 [Pyrinomonadaceae bacterium]
MFRKSFISFIFISTFTLAGYTGIMAQFAPVNGKVELKKADGTLEPVAGALIEVYRTDIKAGAPSAKTGKNGSFGFAGLPLVGTFTFAVSAANCAPTFLYGIRPGRENISIILSPGDGRKFTEEEIRKGGTAQPKAGDTKPIETSADQKKAEAEFLLKKKEVEEKNKKAVNINEIVNQIIKEGNDALTAKNYDLAITKYQAGVDADPDFVGSAPIFYNNKGASLTARAVDTYNKAVKMTNITEKVEGYTSARKDLAEASQGFVKAWDILKNPPAADIVDRNSYEATKLSTLSGSKDTFWKAVRTEQVDPATIEAAKILIPEYQKLEPDAAKKAEASLIFADLYRVTGDSENAIAAYKKILETSPNDLDALAGAGLSLVNLGYIEIENAKTTNDKAMTEAGKLKLQEGSNLLAKYAAAAPDTHKYKADAVALIDNLKKEQNVTPQKVTTTKKKN